MPGIATSSAIHVRRLASLGSLGRWLWPAAPVAGEIRALDGLRGVAALSVVAFHVMLHLHVEYLAVSQAVGNAWYYLSDAVQLFFVLSGFLLFRPYARAILTGAPLPSAVRFYQRRAWRIVPVYVVTLLIVFFAQLSTAKGPLWLNFVTHALFLHDDFPRFNRDLDGPFWTLAVEVQFYLLLPLIAAALAWGVERVGRRRSLARLAATLLGAIVVVEIVRVLSFTLMSSVTPQALSLGGWQAARYILSLALMGMQGKNLEVFLMGALCGALHFAFSERQAMDEVTRRRIGLALLIGGVALSAWLAPHWQVGAILFTPGAHWGWAELLYPLLLGVSFGGITLGIVWGIPAIRLPFERGPLRFAGLISYSIYLWHLPIIQPALPILTPVPFWGRVALAFVVAYLSYQALERPFMGRRQRLRQPSEQIAAVAPAP